MNYSIENSTNFSLLINLDVPMNLRFISLTQQIYHSILTVVGTLINFFLVFVVYFSRQLHYPRHLFWVAISLINQFSIIQTLLEIVAILHDNRVACQIFVFNAGVSYTISLTFLALAALDRYLAIARYEWYKKKVTNRGAIYLLSFGFFVRDNYQSVLDHIERL